MIHDRKTSFFPQLFILINRFGIRFGLCYGDRVSSKDDFVTLISKDTEIQNSLLKILKTNTDILFLVYPEMVANLKELTPLLINSREDLVKNWSSDIHLVQYFSKDEIPNDIENVIAQKFNALLPAFKKLSLSGIQPIPEKSLNYWQIAPGAGAKDWDYCKEKGIIPIYFEDYLQDLSPEILSLNKDQLREFCSKYQPKPTVNSLQMIWMFLHEVNEGDYVLVNKGRKKALGWGIIKSPPKIFNGEQPFTFYRDVNWQDTELNRDLDHEQGKNFFITIQPISKELFDSIVNPHDISYWALVLIGNGETKEYWNFFKDEGVFGIGYDEYVQFIEKYASKLLEFDSRAEFEKAFREVYPNKSPQFIWQLIYEMNIGDVVIASTAYRGRQSIIAHGVIKSDAQVDLQSPCRIFRNIDWQIDSPPILIPDSLKAKFSHYYVKITLEEYQQIMGQHNQTMSTLKKQVILYGPPGTGKTYSSVIKAHEIIFGYTDPNITYRSLQEKLKSQPKNEIDVSQLTWLESIILTFYELKKEKLQVDEIKKSKIIRDFSAYKNNRFISNTIWNLLLRDAKIDSETVKVKNKTGREYFDKDVGSNWSLTEKGKEFQKRLIEDLIESPESSDSQFNFITFHQSFSYEDFVEGIRPELDSEEAAGISYRIKDGIFKEICKKAVLDPQNNYVLIIDEINRGNISKIFGELITLLEENKRTGEKEEITVKLPYSNETFGVPSNVYIIGTMNSTDKSIALVDIALRRRFHFERLNVEYELIKNSDAKAFLKELNSIICAAKNTDYDIGHYYFMNIPEDDPGNQELKNIFSNQILPLLEEYFFNDWEALATILGREAIKIETKKKFVWDEDSGKFEEDEGDYDQIYGRCLESLDTVFESTMKNLGIKKRNQESNP